MNRKFFTELAVFLLVVISLSSCYDKDLFDSDKLSESIEWEPNCIIPVGYAKYEIWDLLDKHDPDADIQNIDNVITILHKEEDIFRFNADDIIDIPSSQSSQNIGIRIPDSFEYNGSVVPKDFIDGIDISSDFTLQEESGEVPFTFVGSGITLHKLVADFSLKLNDASVPFDYKVEIEFPNLIFSGSPYKVIYNGSRNNPNSVDYNLPNAEINFISGNKIRYNVKVTILAQNNVSFKGLDNIDLYLTLEDIVFHRAEGDFGNMLIDLGNGEFNMEVDLWDELDGDVEFADPKIKLKIHNKNVGIPFAIDAHFIGSSNTAGKTPVDLNEGPESILKFQGVTKLSESHFVEYGEYNKGNSNIVELFALPPDNKIQYSGSVGLNPDGPGSNFISEDAEIILDAEVEVPLNLKTQGLTFRDTIRDIDLDIDSDDTEKIIKACIVMSYKSEIPMDIEFEKINFLDASMNTLSSLSDILIVESPRVDEDGNVVKEIVSISRIELSRETIDELDQTDHIEIIAKASTTDSGVKSVKIPADAIIDFNIAFEVKLNLSNE